MGYRVTMLDDHLETVSNVHRRRLLLDLLRENPRTVRTDTANVGGPDERERAVLMYHLHLPKLEDHGYIEWDDESEKVTKGDRFAEIVPILTVLSEYRDMPSDSASTIDSSPSPRSPQKRHGTTVGWDPIVSRAEYRFVLPWYNLTVIIRVNNVFSDGC